MSEANNLLQTDLVRRSIAGDAGAFEAIVRENLPAVTAVAYALTGDKEKSEDVSQETFLIAWQRLSQLNDPGKLRSWLCAIARNAARSLSRKQAHSSLSEAESPGFEIPATGANADEMAMDAERERIVWQAVEQIPEDLRVPLVMYYRESRSTRQVAEALDISEEAVRQRMSRARGMIKDQVACLVEDTLESGGPSPLLVGTIISGLGAAASSVSAGALVTGGAAKAAGLNLTALLGGFLGLAIGIWGGFCGTSQRIKDAQTEGERLLLIKLNRRVLLLVIVWAAGVAASIGASWLGIITIKAAILFGTVWLAAYFTTLYIMVRRTTRTIRAHREAVGIQPTSLFESRWGFTGRDFARQAAVSPARWRISVFSGFGGSILGMLGSLLILAAMAGDWPLYFATMSFGMLTAMLAIAVSLKHPVNYWLCFFFAMLATAIYSMWAGWFFLSRDLWDPTRSSHIGMFTVPEFLFVAVAGLALLFGLTGLFLHSRART